MERIHLRVTFNRKEIIALFKSKQMNFTINLLNISAIKTNSFQQQKINDFLFILTKHTQISLVD